MRSGTSIGANIEESIGAESSKDFISKLSVAYKEARETKYWLNLLKDTDYININEYNSIHDDCDELCRIIASIQKTMKAKNS